MHDTVLEFARRALTLDEVCGKRVLEVGSFNINGTIRSVIEPLGPAMYVGTDMHRGLGVDQIVDAGDLHSHFGESVFDLVVCVEALEHVEYWRAAIRNMKAVLKPSCPILLTTRSWGFPLHNCPDYWRFELADMARIFGDFFIQKLEADTLVAGVFLKAIKPPVPQVDLDAIHPRSIQEQ